VIQLPTGTKIWIAAGVTDLRRGFDGLSAQIQTVLNEQPLSGHVFVFRGRRGDIVKLLWWDGDGLCLFAKRLERGRAGADRRSSCQSHSGSTTVEAGPLTPDPRYRSRLDTLIRCPPV
jgi:transposase